MPACADSFFSVLAGLCVCAMLSSVCQHPGMLPMRSYDIHAVLSNQALGSFVQCRAEKCFAFGWAGLCCAELS